jgi:hypothetical protein
MDPEICARMVDRALDTCSKVAPPAAQAAPPIQLPPTPQQTNMDALAVAVTEQGAAIAAQANYLTFGSILLAAVAIIAAVGWGYLVRRWAVDEAQRTVKEWLDKNGPGEIAKIIKPIAPSDEALSPDAQAEALSEDRA